MRFLLLALLVACHHEAPPPTRAALTVATPPIDAGAAIDAEEAPVGAVPIPTETREEVSPLVHRDTTIALAQLPLADAKWKTRKSIPYRGQVSIALSLAGREGLRLFVVDTATPTESGYPGSLDEFALGTAGDDEYPEGGNAYPARDIDPTTGRYTGPIMFAVRILPRTKAPEGERHHFVVYQRGTSIFVADKLVTGTEWQPLLRIDAPRATSLVAMNPGWH